MEICVTFPDEPATKESLKILKKVGQGKFNVYRAYSPSKRKSFAAKAFPKDAFGMKQYEKEALISNLSHPNIIQYIPTTAVSTPADSKFNIMLTEFAGNGDFFELVVGGALKSEIIIRTYFHQLIAAIEYLHSNKLAHLDLKLENLMLGSDYSLKIIDFDQAQRTSDEKITSGGTKGYRAPEVIDGSCEDLCAADIYSVGVILYAFKAQEYPFGESIEKGKMVLKHYSTFTRNKNAFWDLKAAQYKDKTIFSEGFQDLVSGMLDCDAVVRFNFNDIKKTTWYNGPILDNESLKVEVQRRLEEFENSKK
jgi:serine/threonine protein kinase